jgi:hypothetical protein
VCERERERERERENERDAEGGREREREREEEVARNVGRKKGICLLLGRETHSSVVNVKC